MLSSNPGHGSVLLIHGQGVKTAMEPYELTDPSLPEFFMAASHGAVEILAEQWKIRNVAHANLLTNRSFPENSKPT